MKFCIGRLTRSSSFRMVPSGWFAAMIDIGMEAWQKAHDRAVFVRPSDPNNKRHRSYIVLFPMMVFGTPYNSEVRKSEIYF